MSYIRWGSNPEVLYIWTGEYYTTIAHCIEPPLSNGVNYFEIPEWIFKGIINRWIANYDAKVIFQGASIEECHVFTKTGKSASRKSNKYGEETRFENIMGLIYRTFLMKISTELLHHAEDYDKEVKKLKYIFHNAWFWVDGLYRDAHPSQLLIKFSYKENYFYMWKVTWDYIISGLYMNNQCDKYCHYKNPAGKLEKAYEQIDKLYANNERLRDKVIRLENSLRIGKHRKYDIS